LLVRQWSEGNFAGNREDIWRGALDHIFDRPLLGLGLGNQTALMDALGMGNTTHNIYLDAVLEVGLVGAAALFVLLWNTGRRLYRARLAEGDVRRRPLRASLFVAFVIGLINAFQEPSFWGAQYAIVFWFIVGIGVAANHPHEGVSEYA
jgi:O-antigen ligase